MAGRTARLAREASISGRPRKYAGFSRAPAASAGTRRAHTCHQHARARRAPADTTVAAASDPPYFRARPLHPRQRLTRPVALLGPGALLDLAPDVLHRLHRAHARHDVEV